VSITGRALALLLLAVSLALGMAIVLWTSRDGPTRSGTAPSAAPAIDPGPQAAPTNLLSTENAGPLAAPPPVQERSVDPEAAADSSTARFEGRGVIRGELVAQMGARVPDRWSLLLEPHPWLEGGEKAETRRIDFEHAETAFEVDDLPLGGYLVRASTADWNDLPASVLLVRGSPEQFVTIALRPSGFVDGSVLDAEGRPAEGLDVTLESRETHRRATVTTDAAGSFLFRNVQDGEYVLSFGRPDSPLLPAETLAFKAPSLRFPTRTLPGTAVLKIEAVDENLQPQARARISGSAPGASAIDVFADHLGRATIRWLLPGHYLIDVMDEQGREGHMAIDLEAGKVREHRIPVRTRRTPR
jgi:hypothetical protein